MTERRATQSIDDSQRRPIRSRGLKAIQRLGAVLARRGISPNAISLSSMVFALAASVCMVLLPTTQGTAFRLLCLLAAAGVQLRLLANLMDGVVAQQAGKASLAGRLLNEWPDRVSDFVLLVGFGWLVIEPGGWWLGLVAGCGALSTAYCREMGRAVGAPMCFIGPMAKPQRMAVLTAVLLLLWAWPAAGRAAFWGPGQAWGLPAITLWLISAGCLLTCVRRLVFYHRYAAKADQRGPDDDG